jgi:transcriptional regulator with XRE-family HTH domain
METEDPVDRLYARAAKHGITMAAICEAAGVAPTTPSRWKNDRNGATLGTIRKLNAALDRLCQPDAQVAA